MSRLSYRETVAQIESLGIMPDRAPSLEPMQKALQALLSESHFKPSKTVVVAGTNGKGSVCATLEKLFLATGERVGLYTSPHLEETTERIRVQGEPISEDVFCQAYHEVYSRTKAITRLSHFETLTLMAAFIFFSGRIMEPVDRAIFEVGLGGTWDATNAIPHDHCIITRLGYDHQNLLGNTLEQIAANKFGIIHDSNLVVHTAFPEEVQSLAQHVQAHTRSKLVPAVSFKTRVESPGSNPQFFIQTPWGEARLALPGQRGAENTATALTYFQQAGYDPAQYLSHLAQVSWSGRMEKWTGPAAPCPVFLSGDHNPQGIQSLIELLPAYSRERLFVLVGVGKDKDHDQILSSLFQLRDTEIFLTETPFKGRNISDYGSWSTLATDYSAHPEEALRLIFNRATERDLILVTGSLYLVGLIKKILRQLST